MRKLDDWLKSYGEYTSMIQESPSIFNLWSGIAVISSALRRKVWLSHPPKELYPNLFIVLVSPPGRSRKGSAISIALDLLEEIPGLIIAAEEVTRQALIRDLANSTKISMFKGKQIIHSSIVVISGELSIFLGFKDLKLLATLCELYDCRGQFSYRTINRSTDLIKSPWLTLLGASTPDWLISTLPMDAHGGGFTRRVIFVVSEDRAAPKPSGDPPKEAMILREKLVDDLLKIATMTGNFTWIDDAQNYYNEWYIKQYNKDFSVLGDNWLISYFETKPTIAVKLAMILSASLSNSRVITINNIKSALDILAMTEEDMPRAFRGAGRNPTSQDIWRVLDLIQKKKDIGFSTILAANWQNFGKSGLEDILETLLAANKIIRVVRDKRIYYQPK